MTLDATARALADRLTDQFGKTVVLQRQINSSYDGATDTGGEPQIPSNHTVKVTPPEGFMFSKIDGTLIGEGDQVVSLPALNSPITPNKTTDKIIMDDSTWKIKQVGRLWSGEQVAMYILHLTQ